MFSLPLKETYFHVWPTRMFQYQIKVISTYRICHMSAKLFPYVICRHYLDVKYATYVGWVIFNIYLPIRMFDYPNIVILSVKNTLYTGWFAFDIDLVSRIFRHSKSIRRLKYDMCCLCRIRCWLTNKKMITTSWLEQPGPILYQHATIQF